MCSKQRKFSVFSLIAAKRAETEDHYSYYDDDVAASQPHHFSAPRHKLDFTVLLETSRIEMKSKKNRNDARPKGSSNHEKAEVPPQKKRSPKPTRKLPMLGRSKSISALTGDNKCAKTDLVNLSGKVKVQDDTHLLKNSQTGLPKTPFGLQQLHCFRHILPSNVVCSVVGTAPRASMVVISKKKRAAVQLIWNSLPTTTIKVGVIPLVGCGNSLQQSWETAQYMETTLNNHVESLQRIQPRNSSHFGRYWVVSNYLHSTEDNWVEVLGSLVPSIETLHKTNAAMLIQKSLTHANINAGRALDKFDLICSWYENDKSDVRSKMTVPVEQSNPGDTGADRVCLVCFEETKDEPRYISPVLSCGHYTCLECSHAYLEVASRSGQGSISCSSHRCKTRVNFLDAAHILFGSTSLEMTKYRPVFAKLVNFELNLYGINTVKGRFCPSPGCDRLLDPPINATAIHKSAESGCSFFYCTCGANVCARCTNLAHPGVSCRQFEKLSSSFRRKDEVASLTWLLHNSRPCPQCSFPINRNGGCNHVRCQMCQYYFCWECGGLGNKCMAYSCSKSKGSHWWERTGFDAHHYEQMGKRLEELEEHMKSTVRLSALQRAIAAQNSQCILVDEQQTLTTMTLLFAQIEQVILWLQAYRFARNDTEGEKRHQQRSTLMDDCPPLTRLQTMRNALLVRTNPLRFEIPGVKGFNFKAKRTALSKRKQQTLESRCISKKLRTNALTDKSIFVESDLKEYAIMNEEEFIRCAHQAIRDGILLLSRKRKKQKTDPPKYEKSKGVTHSEFVVERLNQKMSRREPWKIGMMKTSPDETLEDLQGTDVQEMVLGDGVRATCECPRPTDQSHDVKRNQVKWKGKTKVSARRAFVLSLSS